MRPSSVPSLSRGLLLLELVAASDRAIGFAELIARAGAPRASVARMLALLRDEGWIVRGDQGYRAGLRLRAFAGGDGAAARARALAPEAARRVARATGCSALLAWFRGASFEVLASDQVENGVALQPPGAVRNDLSGGPWGIICCASLDDDTRAVAIARAKEPRAFRARLGGELRRLASTGYALDDARLWRGVRRLGVPVRGDDGRILGAIGIGAFSAGLPLGSVRSVAACLATEAGRLAAAITAPEAT